MTLDNSQPWTRYGLLHFSSETNRRCDDKYRWHLNSQTPGQHQDLYSGFYHDDYDIKNFLSGRCYFMQKFKKK